MPNRPRFTSRTRLSTASFLIGRVSSPMARLVIALAISVALISPFVIFKLIPNVSADTSTPVSVATLGAAVTQNFDTLVSSGTGTLAANTPTGWGFAESGTSTNTTYTAGTGSANTGDTYSFGSTSSAERAFGGLQSGSLIPTLGASFTNNTGATITSLEISYTGEQWRIGNTAAARDDRLDFQYSVNATSLTTGTWTDVNTLDFTNMVKTAAVAGALDGNNPANRILITNTISGLTIANGATFFIRWTDFNAAGSDDGLAVDDFSLTASGVAGDNAPTVSGTSPLNGATGVQADTNITVNFSESVNATTSSFTIECPTGAPQIFTLSTSPSNTFTLNPDADLPFSSTCTVQVIGTEITDADTEDPPNTMASNVSFSFTTQATPPSVIINELDSDTPGSDAAEFIELYDGGVGNTSLNGLVVVFYNGSNDLSYASFDLDGFSTDANGYFTLGNPAVPGVDLIFNPGASGLLQNGADAVALYVGDATNFPNNTPVTNSNLVDAVVYDTSDADDPGLLTLVRDGQPQVNEGDGGTSSIGRCPNGSGGRRNTSTYFQGTPSSDGPNSCPPPQPPSISPILISQLYGGGGNSGATYQNDFVELFNRSGAPVDITGWSIQYTSGDGDSWDFGKQPLGGTIGPGEYYLVALGSGGTNGSPLPPAQINGQTNMSATSGKIALVNSFNGLVGNCPLSDPSLMDFVGYGSPDCREGAAPAPSPSNTTAILRLGGGSVDTNNNGNDFITGPPNPRQTAPIVELGPLVLSTDPRNNGTNAPRDASMTITFTEPVDVVDPWFDITCPSGQHNSSTFAITNGGRTHVITPNVNFVAGEQCTVTIFKDQIHDQDLDDGGTDTDTLPANYVWTFTVADGTAPPYPSSVHLTMGDPGCGTTHGCAVASTSQPDNFLMDKPEYSLSYDRDLGRPNWVSWHLSDEWVGTLTRVDTFRPDPGVPPDWYRVQAFDFSGSGFDRGHMVPNADRDKETSIPINQATFLMSNMLAQSPDNNQGPWADLENYLRTLLPANELYIVSGPDGVGGTGSVGFATTIAGGNVTVPAQTWKVALVIPKDNGDDVARVNCSARTIAVLMPNIQGIRTNPWENYITTVDAVETLTGYDFFSNLPDAIENCVEAGTNGTNTPATANQSASTQEDTAVEITLQAARPDADPLTFSIVSGPTNGSLGSIGAPSCTDFACTASVTYTPGTNYNGSDSFAFKVKDGTQDSNTSTVNITVTAVNDNPDAVDDSATVAEDSGANTISVRGNDTDVEGHTLTVTTVTQGTNGSVAITNSGADVSYTPNSNFFGNDSFTYTVSDGNGGSDTATVNITVTNVNDAPVLTSGVTMSLISSTNSNLFNVGLTASATDQEGETVTIQVTVFGDEDDETATLPGVVHSPDAKDIARNTLRLRGERVEANNGRVYLIVVTATDTSGGVDRNYHTVVVPKNNKQANIDAVIAEGAAAAAFAEANGGTPPPGYFVIGDGAIIGPKQ